MKSGRTNTSRQLRPLQERLTMYEKTKRAETMDNRGKVAQLCREHAITRGVAVTALQVLQRGLWGRLKWLLVGK